jgi:hypothetical protein
LLMTLRIQVHPPKTSLISVHTMTNFERTGGQTAHSYSYSHWKQGVQTLWG